ncbi:MAG TPA: CaiB/BaiF CoA-transferase family protein [Acetobacteraceae bacterium]|nr:CaiB/BaiF CoA-transferase family protein [Acetobacteraceae bacterium]
MGPLAGIRIVELAGIGPSPMCAMLLADLGATVLRIDRRQPSELGIKRPLKYDLLLRNRKSIALDLKDPRVVTLTLELVAKADALIEGFRPGVAERLGLGPEPCLARNRKLVYGRMTGWGQNGPLSHTAGHDLGYIAITGVLNAIGRADSPPSIPLNLVGDYAGGSLFLALGIVSALLEARSSGQGQVIDAAIVDGTAALATTFFGMHAAGMLQPHRGSNFGDSGAPFYDVYECADGKWLSVGPLEAKFYAEFLRILQLDPASLGPQMDREHWPRAKVRLSQVFRTKPRSVWCGIFADSDACVAPVLDWQEAPAHPHLAARNTFVSVDGIVQPAPAPRFSRTVPEPPTPPQPVTPSNTDAALASWVDGSCVDRWRREGLID